MVKRQRKKHRKSRRTGLGVAGMPGRCYELTVTDGVRSLPAVDTRGVVRSHPESIAPGARRRRADRLRCVRRGRLEHPGSPVGGWGCSKWGERDSGRQGLRRSPGGVGRKLHLLTGGRGMPLGVLITPGESKSFELLMDTVNIGRRCPPNAVAVDKGYSCPRIRAWLSKRAIETVIPKRSEQPPLNRKKYRGRNVIERCIGWLKRCRRVATRYEKPAESHLAIL